MSTVLQILLPGTPNTRDGATPGVYNCALLFLFRWLEDWIGWRIGHRRVFYRVEGLWWATFIGKTSIWNDPCKSLFSTVFYVCIWFQGGKHWRKCSKILWRRKNSSNFRCDHLPWGNLGKWIMGHAISTVQFLSFFLIVFFASAFYYWMDFTFGICRKKQEIRNPKEQIVKIHMLQRVSKFT